MAGLGIEATVASQSDVLSRGQAHDEALDGDQTTRLQRVALCRHKEGEDELEQDSPCRHLSPSHDSKHRVEAQAAGDHGLVPAGRVAHEVVHERPGNFHHRIIAAVCAALGSLCRRITSASVGSAGATLLCLIEAVFEGILELLNFD